MTDSPELAAIRARDAEEARFDAAMGTTPSMLELDRRTLLRMLDEAVHRRNELDRFLCMRIMERDALAAELAELGRSLGHKKSPDKRGL